MKKAQKIFVWVALLLIVGSVIISIVSVFR